MALYENWIKLAYSKDGETIKDTWDEHLPLEQKIYEDILKQKTDILTFTPAELAKKYNMSVENICGFVDGIKDACNATIGGEEFKIEDLLETDKVSIDIDFAKLYKKMVEYQAEHLYNLPEWDNVFTLTEQKNMYLQQKKSNTIVKEPLPGRNDACPCGSGKKYKKCCGCL